MQYQVFLYISCSNAEIQITFLTGCATNRNLIFTVQTRKTSKDSVIKTVKIHKTNKIAQKKFSRIIKGKQNLLVHFWQRTKIVHKYSMKIKKATGISGNPAKGGNRTV